MPNQLTVKQELTEFLLYTTPNGKVKVEIGLVKGKKLHDKREVLKQKAMSKDIPRSLKERSQ